MAVINSVPGLKVWVKVGREAAAEYEDPDDDVKGMDVNEFDIQPAGNTGQPPYVIKYIEAKPGACYSFHFTKEASFQNRSHHVAIRISVDGLDHVLCHIKEPWSAQPQDLSSIEMCSIVRGNPKDGYQEFACAFSSLETGMELTRVFGRGQALRAYQYVFV